MKITPHQISIRELTKDYKDSGEDGVIGYGEKLDIRPPYQREFVYDDKKRAAVIHSVRKGYPLNVFYWVDKENGEYEILDGQQRTISICEYVTGVFSVKNENNQDLYFHNLKKHEQDQILDYAITVYFCTGSDRERLEWFEIINIAGEVLTQQELLNANYTGTWLSDAKRKFSKTGCVAAKLSAEKGELMNGSPIRQDYLETVLKWISNHEVAAYMAKHQHDADAEELLNYFKQIVHWTRKTFKTYYKEMKGLPWGEYFNEYGQGSFDVEKIDQKVKDLMEDHEVTKKRGVFAFVLTGEEKHLNLRAFDHNIKRSTYEKQNGICNSCGEKFDFKMMQADHILPWSKGGQTTATNCQLLCIKCNQSKGNR